MRSKTLITCILHRPVLNIPPAQRMVYLNAKVSKTQQEKRNGGRSRLLIVLTKISHPTKMAAPRRTRMTHQLTRRRCDRRRLKQIIGHHDIGSVVALSVFAARRRRRTVETSRELEWGPRRRCLWWWKESQRYLCVEPPIAGLVATVRADGALEEHRFYGKAAASMFNV